jgi:phosphohistidine swiveling domain-containing protein
MDSPKVLPIAAINPVSIERAITSSTAGIGIKLIPIIIGIANETNFLAFDIYLIHKSSTLFKSLYKRY